MKAPISRGKVASTTDAMRQLSANAITNAVAASAIFCTTVDRRSAIALRTNVASVANFDASDPVLFSSLSNQPISWEMIAVIRTGGNLIAKCKSKKTWERKYENLYGN